MFCFVPSASNCCAVSQVLMAHLCSEVLSIASTYSFPHSRGAAHGLSFVAEGGEHEGLALALMLNRRLTQTHGLFHPLLSGSRVSLQGKCTFRRQSISQNLPLPWFPKQFWEQLSKFLIVKCDCQHRYALTVSLAFGKSLSSSNRWAAWYSSVVV